MSTIIPCSQIESERDRLLSVLTACSVLTAETMQDLVNFIYSSSLCSGGELTQDNVVIVVEPNTVTASDSIATDSQVVAAINATPTFTISETQLCLFKVRIQEAYGKRLEFSERLYILKNTGAGSYGTVGTALTTANIEWLKSSEKTIEESTEDNDPIPYTISTSTLANLDLPATAINAAIGPYPIAASTDYYFRILYSGSTLTDSSSKLYRYTGSSGVSYGTSGGDTASAGDFILVEESTVSDPSSGLKVIPYETGYVMNGSDTIATAVNNSFKGIIAVGDNELVSFQAQRYVEGKEARMTFYTDKYFWKNGVATLNGSTIASDYMHYETITNGQASGIASGTPEVKSVYGPDIDTPEVGVNNAANTFIIDGTKDWYFYMYAQGFQTVNSAYKLYRWTGANGTYGFGGTAATLADFTLILEDGDESNSANDIFFEFVPDSYLGTRYDFVDPNINGFYFRNNNNQRNGITIANSGTGSNATASVVVSASNAAFDKTCGLQYFGASYFGAPLRNSGGLYVNENMTFTGANNANFKFFSLPDTDLSSMSATPIFDYNPVEDLWRMRTHTIANIEGDSSGKAVATAEYVKNYVTSNANTNLLAVEFSLNLTSIQNMDTAPIVLVSANLVASEKVLYPIDSVINIIGGTTDYDNGVIQFEWTNGTNFGIATDLTTIGVSSTGYTTGGTPTPPAGEGLQITNTSSDPTVGDRTVTGVITYMIL